SLETAAWAVPMTHDRGGGDHEDKLAWGVSIADQAGHEVDQEATDLSLSAEASIDGKHWLTGHLDAPSREAAIEMYRRLQVRVDCEALGLSRKVFDPRPVVRIQSARFSVDVPDVWRYRGIYYLGKLERMHYILQRVTGKAGPQRINIRWQT